MRAIVRERYGGPEVLHLIEETAPTCGPDEVVVRVHAAGLDAAIWHLMVGEPYLLRLFSGLRRPRDRSLGHDLAGRVTAVGAEVERFRVGDDVFGTANGAYADAVATKAENLVHKPASLTFEEAAAVPTSGCAALLGLRQGPELGAGQRVLIVGAAGGVGSFAVQIAKAAGAHVTGVCSGGKVDLVRALGADAVIDYERSGIDAAGEGYDLVLDIAGNRPLRALRQVLTDDGTLVIVGGEDGGRWSGGLGRPIRASLLSPFTRQTFRMFMSAEKREDLEILAELLEDGRIEAAVGRSYPLADVPDAIRDWRAGGVRGKAVIALAAT